MSDLEEALAFQLNAHKLPIPEREWRFHRDRRWRFDFAWPGHRVAAEVEGGVWTQGRHTRGKAFVDDCEKYNAAAALGWRVFRYPEGFIHDGTAVLQLKEVLGGD